MSDPTMLPRIAHRLVGSQAHGLAEPSSDFDYAEIYIVPTNEMLSLGRGPMKYAWNIAEKYGDDISGYEVANFLHLCMKGSPNLVEVLFAREIEPEDDAPMVKGYDVSELASALLATKPVVTGAIGYSENAWRKVTDRPTKWTVGMLRTLGWAIDLVEKGPEGLTLEVPLTGWGATVREAAEGKITMGEGVDIAMDWKQALLVAEANSALRDEPDTQLINDWLLQLRQDFWNGVPQ